MDNKLFLIPSSIVFAGVLIAGAIIYTNYSSQNNVVGQVANIVDSSTVKDKALDINADDYVLGNPAAKVTMVEYGDFQCPFCGAFFSSTLPQIKEKYVKSGKVKLVYRQFPLNAIHENAQKSAEASLCAGEQGKFWEYHDILFMHQKELGLNNYKKWAGELGLNVSDFSSCLDSEKYAERIKKELDGGYALGVNGTPTSFINGKLISGAVPFEDFENAIKEALKQ